MRAFDKRPLSVPDQLELLAERGLCIRNLQSAERLLEVVSLFRLTPYMRPFQVDGNHWHPFREGATLAEIMYIYRFDSDLRQLVMRGLERVEVALRTSITNHMAVQYGSHWYLERHLLSRKYAYGRLISELESTLETERRKFHREQLEIRKSHVAAEEQNRRIDRRKRDNYPRFYAETYAEPGLPPSWAMVEELSLGSISHLYQGLARDKDRKVIAERFSLPQKVLGSWLHTLTFVRNICAHHARLWNRELGIPPQWPQALSLPGRQNGAEPSRRMFTIAAMLTWLCARISPDSRWREHFQNLTQEYAGIPFASMGMPENWQDYLRQLQSDATAETQTV